MKLLSRCKYLEYFVKHRAGLHLLRSGSENVQIGNSQHVFKTRQ